MSLRYFAWKIIQRIAERPSSSWPQKKIWNPSSLSGWSFMLSRCCFWMFLISHPKTVFLYFLRRWFKPCVVFSAKTLKFKRNAPPSWRRTQPEVFFPGPGGCDPTSPALTFVGEAGIVGSMKKGTKLYHDLPIRRLLHLVFDASCK